MFLVAGESAAFSPFIPDFPGRRWWGAIVSAPAGPHSVRYDPSLTSAAPAQILRTMPSLREAISREAVRTFSAPRRQSDFNCRESGATHFADRSIAALT